MNKRSIYWVCQIGGWTIYALINIYFAYLGKKLTGLHATVQMVMVPFYIGITHLYRWVIIKRNWLKLILQNLIPRVIASTFLLSIANYFFLLVLSLTLGILHPSVDLSPIVVLMNILANMILYFLWSLIYFMYHYVENYNRSLKYEAAMHEIELNNLKSQLNPHFIFNALNSVRALVDENPIKAKSAITQLSTILRNSLIMDKKRLINLDEELATVKDFLDLEKIRYEERLNVSFEIDPESYRFQIPPLMIQTLVENGIKHGISRLTHGGKISVETKVEGHFLNIFIRNSGHYSPGKRKNKGFGIENTRQRLKLIFGDAAKFSIRNEGEQMVLTEIVLPQNI